MLVLLAAKAAPRASILSISPGHQRLIGGTRLRNVSEPCSKEIDEQLYPFPLLLEDRVRVDIGTSDSR